MLLKLSSLSVGHSDLCRDDKGDLLGSPNHLWLSEKCQWLLATEFCVPNPLPVHISIKGRQHPFIRFLLRSRVDEKYADLHKSLSSFICSWLASRCSQWSPYQQRFPWALQLKEQITDGHVIFKMPFHLCPLGWGHFLSADDGHDRSLQCLGLQHAEDAFMDDSCACCGHMSMNSLWFRLSFLKGLARSATTRPGLSGSSRGPSDGALGDLRVTVSASPPGTFPRTSYS